MAECAGAAAVSQVAPSQVAPVLVEEEQVQDKGQGQDKDKTLTSTAQGLLSSFVCVLIHFIIELLGLIFKPFDNHLLICWLFNPLHESEVFG